LQKQKNGIARKHIVENALISLRQEIIKCMSIKFL